MSRRSRLLTRYSVHALVSDADGPALLVQLADAAPYTGRYDLPGTIPAEDEAVAEALGRSLKQATGALISDITRLGLMSSLFSFSDENGSAQQLHHLTVIYAVALRGAINLANCLWLPIDLISSENSTPALLWAAEWLKAQPVEPMAHTVPSIAMAG